MNELPTTQIDATQPQTSPTPEQKENARLNNESTYDGKMRQLDTPTEAQIENARANAAPAARGKGDDSSLPGNLDEKQKVNARHAQTFPPNTPHSVINAFPGHLDYDKVLYTDPRNAPKVVDPLTRVGVVEVKETKTAKTRRVAAEKEAGKSKTSNKAALKALESK